VRCFGNLLRKLDSRGLRYGAAEPHPTRWAAEDAEDAEKSGGTAKSAKDPPSPSVPVRRWLRRLRRAGAKSGMRAPESAQESKILKDCGTGTRRSEEKRWSSRGDDACGPSVGFLLVGFSARRDDLGRERARGQSSRRRCKHGDTGTRRSEEKRWNSRGLRGRRGDDACGPSVGSWELGVGISARSERFMESVGLRLDRAGSWESGFFPR
jgi:hypothetical protein